MPEAHALHARPHALQLHAHARPAAACGGEGSCASASRQTAHPPLDAVERDRTGRHHGVARDIEHAAEEGGGIAA